MLKELEEADKVLEENKDLSSEAFRKLEDLYYGNITKWRRFVHSMQLRIAMRMSYVKPAEAQRVAEAAVARRRHRIGTMIMQRCTWQRIAPNCCSITGVTTVSVPTSYPL